MQEQQTDPFRAWNQWLSTLGGAVAVLLGVLAVFPQPVARAAEPISGEELRADITQAYELLKSHHPNLYTHTDRKEFDALYQKLLTSTGETNSPLDAYGALTELTGAVCDEHTMVDIDKGGRWNWPEGWPWFEYPLMLDGGKLYMQPPDDPRYKEEIVSIGALEGAEIAASLAARYPSDGCLDDAAMFVNEALPISGNIIVGMIGDGPHVVKSKRPSASKPRARFISATDRIDIWKNQRRTQRALYEKRRNELRSSGFQRLNLGTEQVRAGLDYWYSQYHDMAYLSLASFRTGDISAEGIDLVMRDVIAKNPGGLIIDLVGNSGGSTNAAQLLMAFLLPRAHRLQESAHVKNVSKTKPSNFEFFDDDAEKLHRYSARFFSQRKSKGGVRSARVPKSSFGKPDYKGRLYVLLDPTSRSNSVKVATNLKRLRNATIVGSVSATDTVTSCPRANGTFKLEHTEFRLHIPSLCYRSPGNRFNDEATLEPDIPINPLYTQLNDVHALTIRAALDDHQRVATN